MKIKTAKYITVLDFEIGRVFQYKLEKALVSFNVCPYEEYITNKGHRLNNCEWMIHEEPRVITTNHKAYQ